MKIVLAVAFAVPSVTTIAQADTVEVNGWPVIIPDGSTLTSVFYVPPGIADANPIAAIDFTFADGFGTSEDAAGETDIGSFGRITFTQPVESLTFFDPRESLCDRQSCITELNGVSIYMDNNHIAASQIHLLEANFKQALQSVLPQATHQIDDASAAYHFQ